MKRFSFCRFSLIAGMLFAVVYGFFADAVYAAEVTTPTVSSHSLKTGYVDMARIVSDSIPAQEAEKKLEKEFSKRQKNLIDQQKFLKSLSDKLAADMPNLSPAQRTTRQKDLQDLSADWNRNQKGFQEDLDRRRYEELRKVLAKASRVTAEIAKAREFGIVVEESIYVDSANNLTDDVLKRLNQDPAASSKASSR